jgi:hypothetical protein
MKPKKLLKLIGGQLYLPLTQKVLLSVDAFEKLLLGPYFVVE